MDEVEKIDNTLWKTENLTLPSGIKYAVIILGPKISTILMHLASPMVYYVWYWTGFKITPTSYKLGHTNQGLY